MTSKQEKPLLSCRFGCKDVRFGGYVGMADHEMKKHRAEVTIEFARFLSKERENLSDKIKASIGNELVIGSIQKDSPLTTPEMLEAAKHVSKERETIPKAAIQYKISGYELLPPDGYSQEQIDAIIEALQDLLEEGEKKDKNKEE